MLLRLNAPVDPDVQERIADLRPLWRAGRVVAVLALLAGPAELSAVRAGLSVLPVLAALAWVITELPIALGYAAVAHVAASFLGECSVRAYDPLAGRRWRTVG